MNPNRRRALSMIAATLMLGILAAAPDAAHAQWRRDREDLPIGRDYRVGVQRLVERLERDSNAFRESYEKRERDGRNEGLKRQIQKFDEAAEDLRRNLGRSDYWLDSRSQVQDMIHRARPIDRAMRDGGRFSPLTEDRWRRTVMELNALALLFGIRGV